MAILRGVNDKSIVLMLVGVVSTILLMFLHQLNPQDYGQIVTNVQLNFLAGLEPRNLNTTASSTTTTPNNRLTSTSTSTSASTSTATSTTSSQLHQTRSRKWLLSVSSWRLGNWLFEYSCAYGISRKLNLTFAMKSTDAVFQSFLDAAGAAPVLLSPTEVAGSKWKNLRSEMLYYYDKAFIRDIETSEQNVTLTDVTASFTYFIDYERELFEKIRLKPDLERKAEAFVREIWSQAPRNRSTVLVSVHIRIGDLKPLAWRGYTVAPASYLKSAVEWYTRKFNDSRLTYLVAAENYADLQPYFVDLQHKHDFVFLNDTRNTVKSPEGDMAILSKCNHSILTTGTFSWWSAFLKRRQNRQAIALYYSLPFVNNTIIGNRYNNSLSGFYPPDWIGLQ